jgi:hypothetical protein
VRTFTDNSGRQWPIELNVDLVDRIAQSETAVDIYDAVNSAKAEAFYRRLSHPRTLVNVLWLLVKDGATGLGITPTDFGRAMGGDSLDDAADALDQAMADFFPRSLRAVMTAAQAKIREIERRTVAVALTTLNGPDTEAAIEGALAGFQRRASEDLNRRLRRLTSDESSTNVPASSASTPAS